MNKKPQFWFTGKAESGPEYNTWTYSKLTTDAKLYMETRYIFVPCFKRNQIPSQMAQ